MVGLLQQGIVLNYFTQLFHLIRFCLAANILKIQHLPNIIPNENSVASFSPAADKTKFFCRCAQEIETDMLCMIFLDGDTMHAYPLKQNTQYII